MKVKELKKRIEQFRKLLQEHYNIWSHSLDTTMPDYPIRNGQQLQEQINLLARQLGTLRPYINKFGSSSIMVLPAAGIRWDIYEAAVSNDVAQRKGPSVQNVFTQLQQILGRLDAMDEEQEISLDNGGPNEKAQSETTGTNTSTEKSVSHPQYEELVRRYEMLKNIVLCMSGLIAALIAILVCEIELKRHPWGWLLNHSNTIAIRVFFYLSILCLFTGLTVPVIRRNWLKIWIPAVMLPLIIAFLQAVTGH